MTVISKFAAWNLQEKVHSSGQRERDVHKYSTYNILCQIDAPTPVNQRGHYCLSKEDNEKVQYAADHYH